MSKIYDALRRAQQKGPAEGLLARSLRLPNLGEDEQRQMRGLYHSIEAALRETAGRRILFTSARKSEGTTQIVRSFANVLVRQMDRSALLLDATEEAALVREFGGNRPVDFADSWRSPEPLANAAHMVGAARLLAVPFQFSGLTMVSLDQVFRADHLRRLQESFDYILLDVPAYAELPSATQLAARVDGVVMVVEAERTSSGAFDEARRAYEAAGGKFLGAVLNRRKLHVPSWLYRRI
jgi:Mrp family chromosome partitioning ATPase